jgi:hypothetical protein
MVNHEALKRYSGEDKDLKDILVSKGCISNMLVRTRSFV